MKKHHWHVRFDTPKASRDLPVLFHIYRSSFVTSDYREYGRDRTGESYVFQLTLSGKGYFRRGDVIHYPCEGQGIFFRTNDPEIEYWRSEDSDGPWEFIFCSFFGDSIGPLAREIIESHGSLYEVSLSHPLIKQFMGYEKNEGQTIHIDYHANIRIVFDLLRLLTESSLQNRDRKRVSTSVVDKAVEVLYQTPMPELCVGMLARTVNVSNEHLIRQFRAQLGQTPHQLITQVRLDLARQLLQNTDLPVKAIAARVGIPRESFSAWFRRNQGTSPGAYRAKTEDSLG